MSEPRRTPEPLEVIGRPQRKVDGLAKVTGPNLLRTKCRICPVP